jgi:hypothetical protein
VRRSVLASRLARISGFAFTPKARRSLNHSVKPPDMYHAKAVKNRQRIIWSPSFPFVNTFVEKLEMCESATVQG